MSPVLHQTVLGRSTSLSSATHDSTVGLDFSVFVSVAPSPKARFGWQSEAFDHFLYNANSDFDQYKLFLCHRPSYALLSLWEDSHVKKT